MFCQNLSASGGGQGSFADGDRKTDSEYVRNGTASIFAFVEPLGGVHHVSVREHRTAIDWAEGVRYLVDTIYPDAEKIILVMDNLNM